MRNLKTKGGVIANLFRDLLIYEECFMTQKMKNRMQKLSSCQKQNYYVQVEKTDEDVELEQLYLERTRRYTEKYAV